MPVRIYEIAKKLGLESKEVISRAKELGIAAAKVPSSSLDKITAEFLEEQLAGKKAQAPIPEPVALTIEPVRIIHSIPVPTAPIEVPEPVVSAAPIPTVASVEKHEPAEVLPPVVVAAPVVVKDFVEIVEAPLKVAEVENVIIPEPVAIPAPEAPQPVVPLVPSKPQLGDKVGFIVLPPKPGPKIVAKPVAAPAAGRLGQRSTPPAAGRDGNRGLGQRPDFRTPQQGARPGYQGQTTGGTRPPMAQRPGSSPQQGTRPNANRSSAPATPKFVIPATGKIISIKPPIIVRELAEKLGRKPFQLIADLMELGVFANVNQSVDELVAQRLAAKHGFRFEAEKRERGGGIVHAPIAKVEVDPDDKPEDLKPRAPVVTIMGHVDHGKTTLLDVIRKADVAAGESGGITQHIGAYTISIPHPERKKELQQITFLDTPGHAAFSSMRARGANVTDIVILVVAANDGVMPQTLEALNHALAAKVPIIVAVNKMDHPSANPMKVRQQLQDKGLVCEEWGGQTIFVDVSAITKIGIEKLLEMIVLQSEILELKANPKRPAKGNVIESGLEPGGPTATVLVRKGTLKVGEIVICGPFHGKVRALIDEDGKRLKEAGPSVAVKLLGLNGVPDAGIEFCVMENEKSARVIAAERALAQRSLDIERRPAVSLETLFSTLASESAKALCVIIKADTHGSVEAIVEALEKIDSSKVSLEVIHSAVGTITASDVALAAASKGIILGFHTRIDNGVSDHAKREGVQIKLYAIIYELIDQVKEAMAGLLDPLLKEVVIGSAEVRQIFELSKGGSVAGCFVSTGRIVKGKMRVQRRKNLIYEGVSLSLRRFQDEVNEVRAGMECGIRLDGFNEFQPGDNIECYTLEKVVQKL